MKKSIIVLLTILLCSCATPHSQTGRDTAQRSRIIFEQDIDQCTAQSELIWCQNACRTHQYTWCHNANR